MNFNSFVLDPPEDLTDFFRAYSKKVWTQFRRDGID